MKTTSRNIDKPATEWTCITVDDGNVPDIEYIEVEGLYVVKTALKPPQLLFADQLLPLIAELGRKKA